MNQRVETGHDTHPLASTDHDALVLDICHRGHTIFTAVAESLTMSAEDRADSLGQLIDELDRERARIVSARDGAYRLAELESLIGAEDAEENRWNEENNGGMPQ